MRCEAMPRGSGLSVGSLERILRMHDDMRRRPEKQVAHSRGDAGERWNALQPERQHDGHGLQHTGVPRAGARLQVERLGRLWGVFIELWGRSAVSREDDSS